MWFPAGAVPTASFDVDTSLVHQRLQSAFDKLRQLAWNCQLVKERSACSGAPSGARAFTTMPRP